MDAISFYMCDLSDAIFAKAFMECFYFEVCNWTDASVRGTNLLEITAKKVTVAGLRMDEKIISKKSLHGMLISQHLNKLSYIGFCQKLEEKLGSIESAEIVERVAGNVVRYPIGTVIEMEDGDITYYLLALTKLDEENHASCSVNAYYQAIISLMDYYDRHGQGRTMAVPTTGAGFSRLNMTEQVLLETLVSTIKMLQGYMRGNIKIVVHSEKRNHVSITNLR